MSSVRYLTVNELVEVYGGHLMEEVFRFAASGETGVQKFEVEGEPVLIREESFRVWLEDGRWRGTAHRAACPGLVAARDRHSRQYRGHRRSDRLEVG